MHELSKQFRFEAAHTLQRRIDAEPSRRIHGHSYRAEVVLRGVPDAGSGMLIDLGHFAQCIGEVREALDHRFLDDITDLGPATLENLSSWIWRRLAGACPGLVRVSVYRDSEGDTCSYFGPG
ncbi:6-carboxy-5,6,7,8-tetrahydropterin synthase [Acidocella aquatica]|uniref:6-carboxy-5,6,7,8-tetrahydropterin synthase n=1 Tax=Acidocella aquatica TaxID=1922313 RepID=A0ABQ6A9T4_9PROT|nr:6-carboxytetrahydropterin synthase [Acidocella aquatica]GLR67372.1 6-carboxy-5,6,7,8-tetrahydropterin synthase [Acidocella aquatica]